MSTTGLTAGALDVAARSMSTGHLLKGGRGALEPHWGRRPAHGATAARRPVCQPAPSIAPARGAVKCLHNIYGRVRQGQEAERPHPGRWPGAAWLAVVVRRYTAWLGWVVVGILR